VRAKLALALLGLAVLLMSPAPALADAQSAVLTQVLDQTAALTKQSKSPAVLFDLDDTLLLTGGRTKAILKELAQEFPAEWAGLKPAIDKLEPARMPHGVVDVARGLGITDENKLKAVRALWLKRFLPNEHLLDDQPLPCAADYVKKLEKAGATVYYVTSRSASKMKDGTEKALRHFGFPLDGKTSILLMNAEVNLPGTAFKAKAAKQVSATHSIVALFENEPANLNVWHDAVPSATAVYVDTVHTKGAPPLAPGLPVIKGFSE
jgi:hypothetical protein